MRIQSETVYNEYDKIKIISALDRVLLEKKFVVAPKSSAFLRYVVSQTLDGNGDRLKAYTIAIDALGKPPTFDPQGNPSVRVLAKRVRVMLSDYYSQTTDHEVILELKPGSYEPRFAIQNDNKLSENEPES